MSRVFRSATLYASTLALESRPLGAAAYTGPAGSRRWFPEAPGPSVGRGLTPLRADTQRFAVFGCGHQSVIPTPENFVLASAQMNPQELASECRGGEHGEPTGERCPRPRGARFLRVIDGENGVISSRAPQAGPFRRTSCTSSNDSNAVTSDSSRAARC
jgi:hypothetical protein